MNMHILLWIYLEKGPLQTKKMKSRQKIMATAVINTTQNLTESLKITEKALLRLMAHTFWYFCRCKRTLSCVLRCCPSSLSQLSFYYFTAFESWTDRHLSTLLQFVSVKWLDHQTRDREVPALLLTHCAVEYGPQQAACANLCRCNQAVAYKVPVKWTAMLRSY